MATLNDLYVYYCRRSDCKPNTGFSHFLEEEYEKHGEKRILYEVDVSHNYLGRKGIIPVLDLVKNTKTVKLLDVSNNRLEHEQMAHLCYCLARHPSIQSLSIANNLLHDVTTSLLVELLEMNPNLVEIDMSGNQFLSSSYEIVDRLLKKNQETQEELKRQIEAEERIRQERPKLPSHKAEVSDSISAEESGGDLHFATWWKNPQYSLRVSQNCHVSITLTVCETNAAKMSGFVVMRYDGIRRVVEIGRKTVVKESPVSATRVKVEMALEESGLYVVMPYTFKPERSLQFSLQATIIRERVTLKEEWITLDKLDEKYDWSTQVISGSWVKGKSAGGSKTTALWRYNDMYRIRYCGPAKPFVLGSGGSIIIQLSKCVDPDDNDEKEIGIDVMEHDTYALEKALPPLIASPQVTRTSYLHERKNSILLKFSFQQASDLDYFIVPSTKEAGQEGSYSMSIFSTIPFEVLPSSFPHGWNYRLLESSWDPDSCGGCREWYQSWKNNPSIQLMSAFTPEENRKPKPLTVFLEMGENKGFVSNELDHAEVSQSKERVHEKSESSVTCGADSAEEAEREFLQRHRECVLDGCVAAVDGTNPQYALRRKSVMSTTESCLTLLDTSPVFYLVPMARHAGQLGTFRLHLFNEDPFTVESVDSLSRREREAQLCKYADENKQRLETAQHMERVSKMVSSCIEETEDENSGNSSISALARSRKKIKQEWIESRIKYSDREFPRGFSSCWLQPDSPLPKEFPEITRWVHASEVALGAGCMVGGQFSPPFPWNKRHWFASLMNAIAAKPHMLSRVFVHYDQDAGFAQFQFFKENTWVGVTVDDYLLVDAAGALVFGHSVNPSDVLFSLLEKAFAKLHRCYEALELKVTPELSLLQVLIQGLRDVTSGHSEVYSLNPEKDFELTVEERENIWRVMKTATSTNILQSLILRSDDPGAGERRHGGILPDHLYGVMDARFVEQRRLVKLRNWYDPRDAQWRGKWAPHSPNWTDTLLEVLEYDHTQECIWLSFDEVLHYFSDLIVTEESTSVSTGEGDFQVVEDDMVWTDRCLRFPQWGLHLDENPINHNSPIKVAVELLQKDARTAVTRTRHATAKYACSVGLAVLSTEDNNRCLLKWNDAAVCSMVRPLRCRDFKCTLEIPTTRLIDKQFFTLVPFLDEEELQRDRNKIRSTRYWLRVTSSDVTVNLKKIPFNESVQVVGHWTASVASPAGDVEMGSAGGPPLQEATWRDNPQFFLYPSENMEVTLTLTSKDVTEGKNVGIGFTVHTTKLCCSFLHYDAESVVLHVPPSNPPSIAVASIALQGMTVRRGMPYIVVPYTGERGVTGSFTLKVLGNRKLTLTPVEPRLDWHRVEKIVSLRTCDGTTGGSPEYPSWRMNPQFVVDFPTIQDGRVFISAENTKKGDRFNKLGMLLLRADHRWDGPRRRRVAFEPEDVVCRTLETFDRVDLDVDLSSIFPKKGQESSNVPLILVVYTNIPYRELDIRVSIYSASFVEVLPVQEWKCVAITEGCWKLGMTTGGSRKNYSSWINNPFLGLTCIRPTQMVAVLIQYPHGPDKPIVKRYKNKKQFLPPPICNPHLQMSVELDLVEYDDNLTPIASSGPVKKHEVVLAAKLLPCTDKPYLLVPSTVISEENGDFKVLVYADHPVDLYNIDKPRMPYT